MRTYGVSAFAQVQHGHAHMVDELLFFNTVYLGKAELLQRTRLFVTNKLVPHSRHDDHALLRTKLLWVARRAGKCHSRLVANEAAVLGTLSHWASASAAWGKGTFELHVFEGEESFADTVRLFARAVLVAGLHGAGTANVLFSPVRTAVLEANACGFNSMVHLSRMLGHTYWPCFASCDHHAGIFFDIDVHHFNTTVGAALRQYVRGTAAEH